MMIMPIIVLLLLGSISSNVHAEITKPPSSGIFLEGSDVTLTCVVEGNDNVVWEDFSDATEIFIGMDKNTEKKKYENFEISLVDRDFSLIIKDVQISDEGTYVCKDKDRHAKATVTIVVLPILHLYVKESEDTQDSQTSTEVNITCSAYKARPAVSVFELSVIGSGKTVNITNDKSNQSEDGKNYNSSATVPFIVSSKDISVHCRVYTAGQSLHHTENFNLPICNITISSNEVRCICQANPPVHKYRMELNGNLQEGDVLYIEESKSANVTCFGTNGMGTGRSSLLFPGNKVAFGIFPIVVMILAAVVLPCTCCLAVTYLKRRYRSRGEKSDEYNVSRRSELKQNENQNIYDNSIPTPTSNLSLKSREEVKYRDSVRTARKERELDYTEIDHEGSKNGCHRINKSDNVCEYATVVETTPSNV